MVDEKVVDGILIRGSHTQQPKGVGLQHVLRRGFIVGEAQAGSRKWSALHCMPFWTDRDHQIGILPPRMTRPSRLLGCNGLVTSEFRNFIARGRSI
jgi:hypothetical protein